MSVFAAHSFLTGLAVTGTATLVVFVGSWLIGWRLRRFNVVDITWGISFTLTAATAYGWSTGHHLGDAHRILLLAMTAVWGLRLAGYIGWRSRGKGEDPRYAAMLERAGGSPARYALTRIFLVQAVIAWFVSLPVQVAMAASAPALAWLVVGAGVWAVGVIFEAVGDAQLAAFRRDPANRRQVMDRGLWRYTRHPNYFGDAMVWAGLWLLAAGHWVGVVTIGSPLLMTWFLIAKTGKPLLERSLTASKPGYADYVARTSGFLPLPPRRASGR
ncbi:MAG TPA: DUF1295 domain-containing protein [Mycobacteriales bacterium]|nr:DUF1295 domain-containing protein [Mycobacteriales bacterium]